VKICLNRLKLIFKLADVKSVMENLNRTAISDMIWLVFNEYLISVIVKTGYAITVAWRANNQDWVKIVVQTSSRFSHNV